MNTYWSDYVQTSEELYRSRALRFHDGNKELWLNALGARDGMDILEIGCGGGIFCHRLKQYLPNARVTGLDFDTGHIAYAKQKSADLGLDCAFVNGDALALPFADNAFDLCYSHTVLEHIPTEPFLAEQKRVLRPGGRIAVLSVRTKYSMPELIIGEESEEEQVLWKKMHAAAEGRCPRPNVGGYELSESDYPKALEAAGFRDVNVGFFNVIYYAPDNHSTSREMAIEQIECERLGARLCIEKSLRLNPKALTSKEQHQLLAMIDARHDKRIAQYERGEKQWDLTARMVLCATGVKP